MQYPGLGHFPVRYIDAMSLLLEFKIRRGVSKSHPKRYESMTSHWKTLLTTRRTIGVHFINRMECQKRNEA